MKVDGSGFQWDRVGEMVSFVKTLLIFSIVESIMSFQICWDMKEYYIYRHVMLIIFAY